MYGHRNDVAGYTSALNLVDSQLASLMEKLREDDLLIITADHGCDPATPSTDHSREYTPVLVYGDKTKKGTDLGVGETFSNIGATIAECFGLAAEKLSGKSFLKDILND